MNTTNIHTTATVQGVVVCAFSKDTLADKSKLSPIGNVKGLDGREFSIDGNALVNRIAQRGLQLPLTVAHQYNGKAAGWCTDFEMRRDGIYATLTLNKLGTDLLESHSYKYLSPEYLVDSDNSTKVQNLIGVSLVNQPNLLNQSLNSQDKIMTDTTKLQQQVAELTEKNTQLAAQNIELSKQILQNKVDNAINAGKLAPSKRDFALNLTANAIDDYLSLESQTFDKTATNGIKTDRSKDQDSSCPILSQLDIEV